MSIQTLALASTPVSQPLLTLLATHLPYSLVLLRRLQYASFPGGTTSEARIVISSPDFQSQPDEDGIKSLEQFTVTYFDLSSGPDTQMYLYSTLQNPSSPQEPSSYESQLRVLVEEMVRIRKEYGKELIYEDSLLLGSLHTGARNLLQKLGRITPRPTGMYDKWLFDTANLPRGEKELPDGLEWADPTMEDCELVVSRTNIPRTAASLMRWPSMFIKQGDTPVAWAFLGQDASLSSLHVEPAFRKRGLAKLITLRLFQEKTKLFGDDGWASSDVSADNEASRGLAKALGGEVSWEVSWILLDLSDKAQGVFA